MTKVLTLSLIGVAAFLMLYTVQMAANPSFDFLNEYENLASNWHLSSVCLKILLIAISVLSAIVGFFQSGKLQLTKSLTVGISLLAALLNAIASFAFNADHRSYEKASVVYASEIKQFSSSYEDIDMTDSSIAAEFRSERAKLITTLERVKVSLLEGSLAGANSEASFSLVPALFAQERLQRLEMPKETGDFLYVSGIGRDPSSLQNARDSAIRDARAKLALIVTKDVDSILALQKDPDEVKQRVRDNFTNADAAQELFKIGEIQKKYFNKKNNEYSYEMIVAVAKAAIPQIYASAQPTMGAAREKELYALVLRGLTAKFTRTARK